MLKESQRFPPAGSVFRRVWAKEVAKADGTSFRSGQDGGSGSEHNRGVTAARRREAIPRDHSPTASEPEKATDQEMQKQTRTICSSGPATSVSLSGSSVGFPRSRILLRSCDNPTSLGPWSNKFDQVIVKNILNDLTILRTDDLLCYLNYSEFTQSNTP